MPLAEIDELTRKRAVRGDSAASRALVERYQTLVFAMASRILGKESHEIDDVAQECFLRVFGAIEQFDPNGPAKLSSWIATIATRVALDAARKRRSVVTLDFARDAADLHVRDPVEALDENRREQLLSQAMERLAPDQRAAMTLRIEHSMPYDEIARVLDVETGTVKSRLARARQSLLEAVREFDEVKNQHA